MVYTARAIVSHTRLGLKKRNSPVRKGLHQPGWGGTTGSWEVRPGARPASTQAGLSKKDP